MKVDIRDERGVTVSVHDARALIRLAVEPRNGTWVAADPAFTAEIVGVGIVRVDRDTFRALLAGAEAAMDAAGKP